MEPYASITIDGDHHFDKCGDEYLDNEDIKLTFDNDCDDKYVKVTIVSNKIGTTGGVIKFIMV